MRFELVNLRSILGIPLVYRLFTTLVGGSRSRRRFVDEFIAPKGGEKILDIGCGPADILAFLPENVTYVGFDASQEYIDEARRRYGTRGQFTCGLVTEQTLPERDFDVVLALGVLHHLDDAEADALFRLATGALRPGGRLITLDGVYVAGQSPFARYFISKDRGQHVRELAAYRDLAASTFGQVNCEVTHDLISPLPYSHLIMTCVRGSMTANGST